MANGPGIRKSERQCAIPSAPGCFGAVARAALPPLHSLPLGLKVVGLTGLAVKSVKSGLDRF